MVRIVMARIVRAKIGIINPDCNPDLDPVVPVCKPSGQTPTFSQA